MPTHNALALSLQRSQTSLLPQSHLGQNPLHQFNNNGVGGLGARADNSSLENLSQQNYDASSAVVINPNHTSTLLTASHLNLQNNQQHLIDTQSLLQGGGVQNTRRKYLVYLGDSRGQVHMTSLYLA